MELITWVIPVAGIAAVLFALYLARDVMSRDTGTPEMVAVGSASGGDAAATGEDLAAGQLTE